MSVLSFLGRKEKGSGEVRYAVEKKEKTDPKLIKKKQPKSFPYQAISLY